MSGALLIAGTHILRNERSHGLHQRAWDQHGKVHDLTGDPVTGGSFESQTVHKGTQSQKRKLRQALLQSQRKTDGKELSTLIVQTEIRPADLKWQFLLEQKNNRTHHTDSLRKNGGKGCSGSIRMESGNEDQITDDIDDTGNGTNSSDNYIETVKNIKRLCRKNRKQIRYCEHCSFR